MSAMSLPTRRVQTGTRSWTITMFVSVHDVKLVEELFPRTIVINEGVIVADAKLLEAHELEKQ